MTALKVAPSTPAAFSDEVTPPAPRKARRGEFRLVRDPEYQSLVMIERRGWFTWRHVGHASSISEAKEKIERMKNPKQAKIVIEDGL